MKFTHLHNHTSYSLLDGLCKIEETVKRAKELGFSSYAITDHGNMFGVIPFYKECKKQGIKPIIGCEFYISPKGRANKEERSANHLVLLAKNHQGYLNLMQLSTKAYLEGFYYKPRIDREILTEHSEGLIAMSACLKGEIPESITNNNKEVFIDTVDYYKHTFGDDFYFELQNHGIAEEDKVREVLIKNAKTRKIKLVCTNDVHYLTKDDHHAHDVLLCVQTGKKVTDTDRMKYDSHQLYMKTYEEMKELFPQEAIENTLLIESLCNVEIPLGKSLLPVFPCNNVDTQLKDEIRAGAIKRFGKIEGEIKDRINYEYTVIKKLGFSSYFLIVQDFIRYAKTQDIPVGPGRGCLSPDSLIHTLGGLKKIENVKIGDSIISEDCQYHKVNKIFKYDCNDTIISFRHFFDDAVEIPRFTKDHKILAIKNTRKYPCKTWARDNGFSICVGPHKSTKIAAVPEYFEADKLEVGDFLCIPITKYREEDIENIDLSLYTKSQFDASIIYEEVCVNKLRKQKINRIINVNSNFMKFLGLYISEGWTVKNGIGLAFHSENNIEQINFINSYFKTMGYRVSNLKSKSRKLMQVMVYSKTLKTFMEKTINKYAANKDIPEFIKKLPPKKLKYLIIGLMQGDGHIKSCVYDKNVYTSISKNLVLSIKEILIKLGIPSGYSVRKADPTKQRPSDTFSLIIGTNYIFGKSTMYSYYRDKNYIYVPITKKTESFYCGHVYDLEVDGVHSFRTNNFIVHNSVAGSIVAYCMGITEVNPLQYNLLFERFLNPDRVSLPDIDVDFSDRGREKVIEYVTSKYGVDSVSQIVTFGTMGGRSVIRDVSRALNVPISTADKIAKLVDQKLSLEENFEHQSVIKAYLKAAGIDPKFVLALEDLNRHASVHAAGVLISPDKITNHCPLMLGRNGEIASQYDMKATEELGLLKMDFLGLRTLTVIDDCSKAVGIDIQNIPFDDTKTYELISKGLTVGVFQFESAGMRDYLIKLMPRDINDLAAMAALYRPGPMDLINSYINRKYQREKINYLHPKMENALKNTYGIMVYQEQVMQLARDIAGFTLAEGDILRKAIGKKNKELLLAQRDKFVKGCIKEGNGEKLGNQLFDLIEKFALYGFNKSHAVGYAILAYQTAYLKANHPAEFMCALLNSEIGDLSRISKIIYDCDKNGIQVLPPSINKSDDKFSVENGRIRFGLQSIRNIGEDFATEIKLQRPYLSLVDLCIKIHSKFYTSRKLESLISAGCFDEFGSRGGHIEAVETVNKTSRNNDYHNLFEPNIKISKDEWTIDELAKREREALGIYFLYNPLSKYNMDHGTISEVEEDIPNGFLCIVDEVKKKNNMAFIKVVDLDSAMECIAFSKVLEKTNFIVGDAYLMNGTLKTGKFRIAKAIPLKDLE